MQPLRIQTEKHSATISYYAQTRATCQPQLSLQCMHAAARTAQLQSAPARVGAGQITGRLRLRAATAALHCAGSEFCRGKGLTRANLRSPKASGAQGPAVWQPRGIWPGGLATKLENCRPIMYTGCFYRKSGLSPSINYRDCPMFFLY